MGGEADKAAPFYFTKSPCHYVPSGTQLEYPQGTQNFHYEMELVIAMGSDAFNVSKEDAHSTIFGYCNGLDMTRRDLQKAVREKGRPWDIAKDFEQSCVLSEIVPANTCGHFTEGSITLSVNGETKQNSDISLLINNVAEIIENLSTYYRLRAGDLIMTGTPAGVGAVVSGDKIVGCIEGLGEISATVV